MTRRGAEGRRVHWIITLYTRVDAEAHVIVRAATGSLSGQGLLDPSVTLTLPWGEDYATFDPIVLTMGSVRMGLDLTPPSVAFTLDLSAATLVDTVDWRLEEAYAEVSEVEEAPDGRSIATAWEARRKLVEGPARLKVRTLSEPVEVEVSGYPVEDTGSFWPPGAALSSLRHADIGTASTANGGRGRAHQANGMLPSIPIVPSIPGGTSWATTLLYPCQVIGDAVDANHSTLTELTHWKWLVTYEPLNSLSGLRTAWLEIVDRRDQIFNASTYFALLEVGTDDLGDTYTFFEGSAFVENLAAGTCDTTAGSTTFTGDRIDAVHIDSYVRISNPNNFDYDYKRVISLTNGGSVVLASTYRRTETNQTGLLIRGPKLVLDAAYISIGSGIVGPLGGALGNPAEVVLWGLARSRLPYRVAWGDLRNLTERTSGWYVTTVLREDTPPLDWIAGHILPWVPIRPYLEGSRLRFYWRGPLLEDEPVCTVSLDGSEGVWHDWGPEVDPTDVRNEFRTSFRWNIRSERYDRPFTATGALTRTGAPVTPSAVIGIHALADASQIRWLGERAQRTIRHHVFKTDSIGELATVQKAANAWLWEHSRPRVTLGVTLTQAGRWLRAGMLLQLDDETVVREASRWRVEEVELSADGGGRAVLALT
ncbi:MAG TPA: hypothetical protein VEI97_14680 [bacterium]|nr:hypothetical protein [bacterium]